jgi:tight adherence protein C
MNIDPKETWILILSFGAVFLFVLGAGGVLTDLVNKRSKIKADKGGLGTGLTSSSSKGIWSLMANPNYVKISSIALPLIYQFAPSLVNRIEVELEQAGLDDELKFECLAGGQIVLAIVTGIMALIVLLLIQMGVVFTSVIALGGAVLGWALPLIALRSAANKRKAELIRELPYGVDLITAAMESGQDFGAAVKLYCEEGPSGPLSQEFNRMLHQISLGRSRSEALRDLRKRMPVEDLDNLVSAAVRSVETGMGMVQAFRIQGEEMRRKRFFRAEQKSARAPVLLMIPVMLLIVPAVLIVILTPIFIRLAETKGNI